MVISKYVEAEITLYNNNRLDSTSYNVSCHATLANTYYDSLQKVLTFRNNKMLRKAIGSSRNLTR